MAGEHVRLAELIASLSLATDLGLGLDQEHVLRQTVIASRLAAAAGMDESARADTFYVSLLAWVGCVADSHELTRWFGDDRRLRADSYQVDKAGWPMMRFLLTHLDIDGGPLRRATTVGRFLTSGWHDSADSFVTHCRTTADIADRLGLSARVGRALGQAFERWDGKGVPGSAGGTEIDPVMRVVQIADDTEVFATAGGPAAAVGMLRARRGTEFDPGLVDVCIRQADDIFAGLEAMDAWPVVIEGCRAGDRTVPDTELDGVLEIFADYADLKSPWYLGHSRAVGTLAAAAATAMALPATAISKVRRAGYVHRLGALGVSTAIWNKAAPLSAAERERVRQVPYFTERILRHQPLLAEIGQLAGLAAERTDGSGYPRGLTAAQMPATGKLLAAAAAYQELAEDRPGRPTLDRDSRRFVLLDHARAGRLDPACVDAVLAAAGHQRSRRTHQVAGLTARETDVLALLVRGLTNRQIADRLSVSARTVATHIEHIFTKTDVSSRGAAAVFALRHGLVGPGSANIG